MNVFTLKHPLAPTGGTDLKRLISVLLLILSLLFVNPTYSFAITTKDKRKGHQPTRQLTRAEVKEVEARLSEMGYGTGLVDGVIDSDTRNALVAFQKWEGLKVTG